MGLQMEPFSEKPRPPERDDGALLLCHVLSLHIHIQFIALIECGWKARNEELDSSPNHQLFCNENREQYFLLGVVVLSLIIIALLGSV
jgi:hypothetical protein